MHDDDFNDIVPLHGVVVIHVDPLVVSRHEEELIMHAGPSDVGTTRFGLAIFRSGRIGWVGADEIEALSKPEVH